MFLGIFSHFWERFWEKSDAEYPEKRYRRCEGKDLKGEPKRSYCQNQRRWCDCMTRFNLRMPICYANTIFYTVVGTIVNMIMSVCLAYPLSDKSFPLRRFFTIFFKAFPSYIISLLFVIFTIKVLELIERWICRQQ